MARWLLKTEPSDYSYDELVKDGRTTWTGVTNPTAQMHMRSIKKGDDLLIYHTGDEKSVVALARATSSARLDPTAVNPKHVTFDLQPKRRLKRSVTLAQAKAEPTFATFDLVRLSRLSVMPVSDDQWALLMKLAGEK